MRNFAFYGGCTLVIWLLFFAPLARYVGFVGTISLMAIQVAVFWVALTLDEKRNR